MKKLLSVVLVVLLMFTITTISPISVSSATTEFAGGNGTVDNPYLISNKNHLNNMRNHLNSNFKLICDIEFSAADFAENGDFYNNGMGFEPIGLSSNNNFCGTFDGNGYAIKNLYMNFSITGKEVFIGLFKNNRGTIKNLGVVNGNMSVAASAKSNYPHCSAIAGGIVGSNGGIIINCYNSCNVSATASVSSYNAHATTNVGGIAGMNSSGTISNCYSTGKISAMLPIGQYNNDVGGIVGMNISGLIDNCYNTGTVSGDYSGGIAGKSYSDATITNCHNTGTILAKSDSTARAGGIVGENGVSNKVINGDYRDCKVENCYNTGDVSGDDYVGGIVGVNNNGTIKNCYNTGFISTDGGAGGIAGQNCDTIVICYNMGIVSGKCAGGITGSTYQVATVANCYNTGTVSGELSARAGGIVGYNANDCTIVYCYNVGTIIGDCAGGIAGYNYRLLGKITDCYYLDNVSQGVGSGNDTTIKCTQEKMTLQDTFIGFDFVNKWEFQTNSSFFYPTLKVFNTYSLLGDINGDGMVSILDATLIQKYLANLTDLEDTKIKFADTNRDGEVTITDVTLIQKYIANLITEF